MTQFRSALTFDDVLLVPQKSEMMPGDITFETQLTRNIKLNIPIMSAAMDTVTEANLAIALANEGGMGIIHKNNTPEEQANEVIKVKKWESGIITRPLTLDVDQPVSDAMYIMKNQRISGFPVLQNGKLVGILTNRDLRGSSISSSVMVSEIMTQNPITGNPTTSLQQAKQIMHQHRIEKLPLVNDNNELMGLITLTDISKRENNPRSCIDDKGHLRVGAAVGVGPDAMDRVDELIKANTDVIVVDTAHGHNTSVADTVKLIKQKYPEQDIIAGNVVTKEAVRDLAKAGADCVKVGVGPGSICTTRIIAGVGVPQLTAVMDCAEEAAKAGICTIADGGIKYSGDIAKALAGGANAVMMGSLFAGTEESPGERILAEGRAFKSYRGMGSLGAMKKGGAERYFQGDIEEEKKLIPEGIEGRIPYKGLLKDTVHQLVGGVGQAMFYCGATNLEAFRNNAEFVQITSASLKESHPHDVTITKEAPNYQS